MRGSIKRRSKDSWTIILDLPRGPDGKRRQQWHTVKGTKRIAEKRQAELIHQIDSGLPVDNSKLRLGEYLETWLMDVVALRNRARTQESYATIVRNHITPVLGSIQVAKLQPTNVERLYSSLLAQGLSANTVHHVHVALSKAIKDAMRKGLVGRNVCQLVQAPSPGQYEVNVPDASVFKVILNQATGTPYFSVFRFMYFTGIRRGEAVALKWENVDLDRGVVSIVETAQRHRGQGIVFQSTKSAAGRRGIAIDPDTINMLRAHRGEQLLWQMELGLAFRDNGLVFPGPFGGPLDPSVLTRNFKKAARRASYPGVRLHDLRHGHAAGLIRSGAHDLVIQKRLGHASAAFTMQVYGHISPGVQREAAEAFAKMVAETPR